MAVWSKALPTKRALVANSGCFREEAPARFQPEPTAAVGVWVSHRVTVQREGMAMNGIIYLVGLVVVIMAILSFLGIH